MIRIKILIIEDDNDWSEAIASFLKKEEDFEIVGCSKSRQQAIEILKLKSVDVILLDINLNGNRLDGIEAIGDIQKYSKAEIIMVTSMDDKDVVMDSIEAGAVNYIFKRDFLTLPNVIRNVKNNKSPLQLISKKYLSLRYESQLQSLTVSERTIFNRISAGHSHIQIEIELNKSTNTVRNQISSILKKLGMRSCREMVKKFSDIKLHH